MNRNATLALIILLAGVLACAAPAGMTPTPVVITQIVVVPNEQEQVQASPTLPLSTVASPTASPPTFTLAPVNTNTATAVSTATTVSTATLSGPVATFIENANCREGPGTGYEAVTSFFKGDTVQIVGRNPDYDNTWWYVVIPSGGKCWVSLTTAQAYGDFDAIPTVVP
jgi:Bacterial SH3 domain